MSIQKIGNTFHVVDKENSVTYEKLPPATYGVKFNENTGKYYLISIDDFKNPSRLYGDVEKRSQRILETFSSRPNQTGVMFSGEKGCGKTLLLREVCIKGMRESEFPIIVINEPHLGDTFNEFIQSIDQPAIIVFDEFEKIYDQEAQEKVLTLFDGVFQTKKLFLVSCNDEYRINEMMINRPGRIFYRFKYDGLSKAFVKEYCEENLKNLNEMNSIINISELFECFSFDILSSIVEEMNRYDEKLSDVLNYINASIRGIDADYEVSLIPKNPEHKLEYDCVYDFSPTNSNRRIRVLDADDENVSFLCLEPSKIISIRNSGKFVEYSLDIGKVILTRMNISTTFDPMKMI